jgi:hypothetical protein
MGAELLEPLAKWGAVVIGVGLLLYFAVRLIRGGAVAKGDLREAQKATMLEEKARLAAEEERRRVDDL